MSTRRTKSPRSKPADGKRLRTTLDWEKDDPVFADLSDLKARARGKRVRALCRLGLVAEEHGVRFDANGHLILPNAAAAPPPSATKLDVDLPIKQNRALDSLAASLLGDFDS